MKKIITVRFEGEGTENCYDLKQWNYGITLRIEGLSLPEKVEVHFALDNSEMAQVYLGTTEDGVTTVKVPAFILENADGIACVSGGKYKAFAYIYQSDEESGWTVRKIIFHIEARQRPEDYIHTEEDLKTWEKLEKRIGEVQQEIPKKLSELENDAYYAKYKYFNFVEIGVDVEGNPTYSEIKEAVENGYIPFLKYGKDGVAHMTISNCKPNDDQNQGQFTFVASNSRADMGWVMEVNEFWCCLQDDGSTLWGSGTHYSEAFIAEYDVTPVEAVIDAYEKGLEIIVKRSATPDQPAHYARLVRADGYGVTPNLTFVCDENRLSHHYHINGEGWHYWCYNLEQKLFIAEYGVTSFAEIQNAYNSGKDVICKNGFHVTTLNILKQNDCAQFSTILKTGKGLSLDVNKDDKWTFDVISIATEKFVNDYTEGFGRSISTIGKYINDNVDPVLSKLNAPLNGTTELNSLLKLNSMNTVDVISTLKDLSALNMLSTFKNMDAINILKSVYSLRGGFRTNAGTMHITDPGIYLVLQAGTGNKQIIINKNGNEVLNEKWNGIAVFAMEGGLITPIGIKTAVTLAGAFQTPGTFQGWTSDGSCSTTINYPAECVIAYLGNGNVNYLE